MTKLPVAEYALAEYVPLMSHDEMPRDTDGAVQGAWHVTEFPEEVEHHLRGAHEALYLHGADVDRVIALGCRIAAGTAPPDHEATPIGVVVLEPSPPHSDAEPPVPPAPEVPTGLASGNQDEWSGLRAPSEEPATE